MKAYKNNLLKWIHSGFLWNTRGCYLSQKCGRCIQGIFLNNRQEEFTFSAVTSKYHNSPLHWTFHSPFLHLLLFFHCFTDTQKNQNKIKKRNKSKTPSNNLSMFSLNAHVSSLLSGIYSSRRAETKLNSFIFYEPTFGLHKLNGLVEKYSRTMFVYTKAKWIH